jgi:ABC-type uncharacterized transport system fused permease/ATPase subunit
MYGTIYTTINKYEYLLPTFSTAIIGLVDFGCKGLALGSFGSVDTIAKSYNIYNKPYLTGAVIGYSALSSFESPYNMVSITGAVIGGLVPTGIIHPHLDKAVSPIMGAIYGSSFGPYGTALGFAAGIIDEYLSYSNITQSHPITYTLGNIVSVNLMASKVTEATKYLIPNYFGSVKIIFFEITDAILRTNIHSDIAMELSIAVINQNNQTVREKTPVMALGNELYELYSKIIPKEQLDGIIENQAIALISGQLISAKMALINVRNLQEFLTSIKEISKEVRGGEFFNKLPATALHALGLCSSLFATKHFNEYFMVNYKTIIRDQINDAYLDGEVALHLSRKRSSNAIDSSKPLISSKILLDKMIGDINSIVETNILTEISSHAVDALYAIGYLNTKNVLYTLTYAYQYNNITNQVTHNLINETTRYLPDINLNSAKLEIKYNYVKSHPLETVINDANDFSKIGRKFLTNKLYEINGEKKTWDLAYDGWQSYKIWLDYFFNSLIVADAVGSGALSGGNAFESIHSIEKFNLLASWDSKNANSIYNIRSSIERISELLARIDEAKDPAPHLPNYIYESSENNYICLNKFKVGVKKESRLYIEDLCIKGKHIAVSSISGGGKSTFFTAIKQITHGDSWSEGNITYFTNSGNEPHIAMTSQATYVPPEDALLELITFKKGKEALKLKDEVIKLLKEVQIDSVQGSQTALISRLTIYDDWVNILSGGQKQKIDFVRLILNHKGAEFLLLDEIFAGLDHDSIVIMQDMFNKYFPNTMIMVIDHEAQSHNFNCWFDGRLHFANGTAISGEMSCIKEDYGDV